MEIKQILMTGGSGLLGRELQKYLQVIAPSHTTMDIREINTLQGYSADTIIHCAAYTDVIQAETDRDTCFAVNVGGTYNLLREYPNAYFVYISSEYAEHPCNFYGYSKMMGEKIVQTYAKKYLIIRTLFKPTPFPFPKAFVDQYTNGDYVDIIAPLIATSILCEDTGISHIGTGKKSIYELALRTKPDVLPGSVEDIKGVVLPKEAIYYG
jgi:dTDP-4-dehydrorhamnose reductase